MTRSEHRNPPQTSTPKARQRAAWARSVSTLLLLACASLLSTSLASAEAPLPGVCPMDFNADGVVNEVDVNALMNAWSTHPGDEGWDGRFDLNGDLVVASQDRGILFSFFGSTDCTAADLEHPPTMWTGTTEYHDTFCPGGEMALAVQDPDATDGSALYFTLLEPEECLRAPVADFAYYACIVNNTLVDAYLMEPISPDYVSSEGNHVCNPGS